MLSVGKQPTNPFSLQESKNQSHPLVKVKLVWGEQKIEIERKFLNEIDFG